MLPISEVLLFNAARNQSLTTMVRPNLERGVWCVADRSFLSTMAYQAHARGIDPVVARKICKDALEGLVPDLMVLLTVSREVALTRRGNRGISDRFEAETEEFHRKVNDGYLIEAQLVGIPILDASESEEEVQTEIWKHVEPLLEEG